MTKLFFSWGYAVLEVPYNKIIYIEFSWGYATRPKILAPSNTPLLLCQHNIKQPQKFNSKRKIMDYETKAVWMKVDMEHYEGTAQLSSEDGLFTH